MSDVESKDLFVIHREEPTKGEKYDKAGVVLRVVNWIYEKKDGSTGNSVQLEKRQLYVHENGEVRTGKAKGFTLDDLGMIRGKWTEIVKTMRNAPKVEKEQKLSEAPPEIEEVSF